MILPSKASRWKQRQRALIISIASALNVTVGAQTLEWDPNLVLPGAQQGSGDWDGGNFWWNGTSNQAWVSGADATFGGNGTVYADGITADDILMTGTPLFTFTLQAGVPGGVLRLEGGDGDHVLSAGGILNVNLPITGTGRIRVGGNGPNSLVSLSGTNTYSGDTWITGPVALSGGNAIPDTSNVIVDYHVTLNADETIGSLSGGSGNLISIPATKTLTIGANGSSTTYSGHINGGTIVKTGSGSLTLSPFRASSVGTTVENGTLVLPTSSSTNIGRTTVAGSAVLDLQNGGLMNGLSGSGEVKLGSSTKLTITGQTTGGTSFGGVISGGTSFEVTNGTVQMLSGQNTFGSLTISGNSAVRAPDFGTAGVPGPLGIGAVNIGNGLLYFNRTGASTNSRDLSLGPGARIGVDFDTAVLTMQGLLSGNGGLMTVGLGTLVLQNAANDYSGGVSVLQGTLSVSDIQNAGVKSSLGTGGSIELLPLGRLLFTGSGSHASDRQILAGGGTLDIADGAMLTLSSAIVNWYPTGMGQFRKGGAGTLVLTGANTYSGGTEINAGTLVTQNANAIPDNGYVTIAAGAKLQIQSAETIAGLNGAGLVEIASNTLTLASTGGGFSGQISGPGQLITRGTQNFAGNNSFSGGLVIAAGEVTVSDFGTEGAPGPLGSGPVTLNGGSLRYIGSSPLITNRPITMGASGGRLGSSGTLTVQSLLAGPGNLTIGSGGTVILENSMNSFNGLRIEGVLATAEMADAGVNSSLGAGNALTIAGGRLRFTGNVSDSSNRMLVYEGTATVEVTNAGVTLQVDSASGTGIIVKAGAGGLIQINPANNFSGEVRLIEGVLQTGKLENSGVPSAIGSGNKITFGGGQLSLAPGTTASTNRTIVLSGSGRIQGNGNTTTLTGSMTGTGTLTFAGADVSSDTFVLNGASSAIGTYILDKATVHVTNAFALPDSAGIRFADAGGGTLRLDVAETLAGITGSAGPGAGRLIVNAPLTVNVNATDVSSVGARLEGSGTVTKAGAGIMALLGANTFTGNIVISRGTLFLPQWSDDSAPPLGKGSTVSFAGSTPIPRLEYGGFQTNTITHQLSLVSGGELSVQLPSATLVWAGSVDGAASAELRKTGPGTLRLSGANGFAGATRIDEGKLQIFGSNALPNLGTVQIGTGATLELLAGSNETIGALLGDGSVLLGGQRLTLSTNASTSFDGVLLGSGQSRLEKKGSGTLTVSNPLSSFTGGTFIADGGVSVPYLRNAGVNSPLGSAGPISLGDEFTKGRLILTSATPGATNRPIALGAEGGIIEVSDPSAEVVLTGPISGNGPLLKPGLGRMRFGSLFAGQIVVANGTFAPATHVSGSVTAINPGRVESIDGVAHQIGSLVLAGGAVAPGGSGIAGALHAGQVSINPGVFELDLLSAAAGDYDQLVLTGALELAGPLELAFNLKFDPVDRVDVFRIVASGSPTIFAEPYALISYQGVFYGDGDEFLVNSGGYSQIFGVRCNPDGENGIELFAAPEPGTATLLLAGLACAISSRRRLRR